MRKSTKVVALEQHMESITVAVAEAGRQPPELYGDIPSTAEAVRKLAHRLDEGGTRPLRFCYEAGPCGYGLYRQLAQMGYECAVVAPSLIPRRPGERIKTDRRDALTLARLHRSGDLVAVWVPDEEQEVIRDLVRCREDFKHAERRAKQRANAFLLRHGRVYPGRSRWTKTHATWLQGQAFDHPVQQLVFQEYVDAVGEAMRMVEALEKDMAQALETWSLAPVVRGEMALRGVDLVVAMTLVAELGDVTRFDSPVQLMAYVGEVPSEHSTGRSRRQGAITKTGNAHVRRVLTEAAWCYRLPARQTAHLQRRAQQTSPEVQAIAWKAQKRLCGRYRHLTARGKPSGKVITAVAREMLGFIWAIAQETMPRKAAESETGHTDNANLA
ncbi:MAG: IS110 family transposase [Planctomycetes bacterium]|nr:IS110 family transposase [Planctomycetota bacterium]